MSFCAMIWLTDVFLVVFFFTRLDVCNTKKFCPVSGSVNCWFLSFHEICWQSEKWRINGAALPFLPVTSRGKSQQWQQRSTSVLLSLRKQTVRCRAPWRLSARWESSLAQQSSLRVQSWATQQSLLWGKTTDNRCQSSVSSPQPKNSTCSQSKRCYSYPSHVGSRGTG